MHGTLKRRPQRGGIPDDVADRGIALWLRKKMGQESTELNELARGDANAVGDVFCRVFVETKNACSARAKWQAPRFATSFREWCRISSQCFTVFFVYWLKNIGVKREQWAGCTPLPRAMRATG